MRNHAVCLFASHVRKGRADVMLACSGQESWLWQGCWESPPCHPLMCRPHHGHTTLQCPAVSMLGRNPQNEHTHLDAKHSRSAALARDLVESAWPMWPLMPPWLPSQGPADCTAARRVPCAPSQHVCTLQPWSRQWKVPSRSSGAHSVSARPCMYIWRTRQPKQPTGKQLHVTARATARKKLIQ